MIKLGEE